MPRAPRPPSRPQRWADAVGKARDALEELQSLKEEYQDWRDNLPENLESSTIAEKLDTIVDLDFDTCIETIEEADSADLPLGFGRD